jgi:hypothetical protein
MLPISLDQENDSLFERWNAQETAVMERWRANPEAHVAEVFKLSRSHRHHAYSLMVRGESDRARRELEEDLNLIRSVPVAETAFPAFILSEALTLAALGQWSGELTRLRSPLHSRSTILNAHDSERSLAELTGRRIGWLPSIVKPPWLIPEDLPNEARTDRVLASMQSDATRLHLDHTRIPDVCWSMRLYCASTLSWRRRAGKLGDAHQVVDRLLALAGRLTRLYPDQAAHMFLSEGYVQRAKIAYRVAGEPVLEWERKALDAAIHAATLEPENEEAHSLVKGRRARLNKLASR